MGNHLSTELSPYLQMHANNPVEWYPWSEEALHKAKSENKPILLSIGYTACHWCHVMAHESFEDNETAQLMNRYFVNVKVDREERPDLDKIYQLSAQLLTRQTGGWPLTVFLMPLTHIPFFAGTYFPRERRGQHPAFKEILEYIHSIFTQKYEELNQQNYAFQNVINELEEQAKLRSDHIDIQLLWEAINLLENNYDQDNGGFKGAPKFPMPTYLELLLIGEKLGINKVPNLTYQTLIKMAQGGLFDHIGGGFFRYSVDEEWQIPHFEKMLYDNAQLLTIYSCQYAISNDFQLQKTIEETADWMIREMQSSDGGFYATLSADTEGKEGKFYVWDKEEIEALLNFEEFQIVNLYYGLTAHPNFQKSWHLQARMKLSDVAEKLQKPLPLIKKHLQVAKKKLAQARNCRKKPQCDNKIICSWNGLAIKSLSIAGFYLDKQDYLVAAENSLVFIMNHLWHNNKLYSIYKEGKFSQLANLDDYAFLIEGILHLLQFNWNDHYFEFMLTLVNHMISLFQDQEAGGFYYTSNEHEKLIYRLKQFTDEAIPSGAAIATKVLLQLGYLLGNNEWLIAAENSLKNVFPHLKKFPDAYSSYLIALTMWYEPPQTIVVRVSDQHLCDWLAIYRSNYLPNRYALFIPSHQDLPNDLQTKQALGESDIAYLCLGNQCSPPISSFKDFANELNAYQYRIKR